jgi:hypothetical protein
VNPAPPTIVGVSRVALLAFLVAVVVLSSGAPSCSAAADFVPKGARFLREWKVPAGGGIARQLLVEWQRGSDPNPPRNTYVLALWQLSAKGWTRALRIRLSPGDLPTLRVQQADVTQDGHLDQVVTGPTRGSGDCGPRRVLATVEGRARQIFRLGPLTCDTQVWAAHKAVVVIRAVYAAHDAHCCATFMSKQTLHWEGHGLRSAGRALFWACELSLCQDRRPLHFRARATAFWDSRRGVAVGDPQPSLIASTRDGGRRWTIVDAAVVPLGAPHVVGAGRARIRFLRCRHRCHGARFAVTSDYGRAWLATPREGYFTWPR